MIDALKMNKLFSANIQEYISTGDGRFTQKNYKTVILRENGVDKDIINDKILEMTPTHKCFISELIPLYPSSSSCKVVSARQAQKRFNQLQSKLNGKGRH